MPKASSSNHHNVVRFGSAEIATRNAAVKLKEALNLVDNATEFEKLRNAFRLLGQDYLKADEAASMQRDVADSIKEMLVEKYPDLYLNGTAKREERLTLTIQLIYEEHNRELAKRMRKPPTSFGLRRSVSMRPRGSSVVSLTSSEPDHSRFEDNHTTSSRSRNTVLPYHRYLSKSCPQANSTSSSTSSNTQSSSHASSSQTTLEDLPVSGSITATTDTSIDSDKTFIAEFLDRCIPTMSDFLDKFLSFGCNCESHVRVISMWDSDSIYDFLQRVSKHSPGPMTEMDMRILETHFSTYFK